MNNEDKKYIEYLERKVSDLEYSQAELYAALKIVERQYETAINSFAVTFINPNPILHGVN